MFYICTNDKDTFAIVVRREIVRFKKSENSVVISLHFGIFLPGTKYTGNHEI